MPQNAFERWFSRKTENKKSSHFKKLALKLALEIRNFQTENQPKIKLFDFGAFQKNMRTGISTILKRGQYAFNFRF